MLTNLIGTNAQRSGALGLTARILSWHMGRVPSSARTDSESLTVLFCLSHGWARAVDDIIEDAAQIVQPHFSTPDLDSVHMFTLRCDNRACRFYRESRMPNLRYLTILQSVPALPPRQWSGAVLLSECRMDVGRIPEGANVITFLG